MGTPLVATRTWSLKPLGALRLWTIIGLVGTISVLIYILNDWIVSGANKLYTIEQE